MVIAIVEKIRFQTPCERRLKAALRELAEKSDTLLKTLWVKWYDCIEGRADTCASCKAKDELDAALLKAKEALGEKA